MRQSTRKVLEAFRRGEECHPRESIYTNGVEVYSYDAAIVVPVPEGHPGPEDYILNATKYSLTSSEKQNAARGFLGEDRIVEVRGLPREAGPDDVVLAYHDQTDHPTWIGDDVGGGPPGRG